MGPKIIQRVSETKNWFLLKEKRLTKLVSKARMIQDPN
jgi:hypothetical protein